MREGNNNTGIKKDFSKWESNIKVIVINRIADVILNNITDCPGAKNKDQTIKIDMGNCSDCIFYMGIDDRGINYAFVGDIFSGCCWSKILSKEER